MLVFSKVRELFVDSLKLKLDIEEIKRRLANQDKNLELVFTYLVNLLRNRKALNMLLLRDFSIYKLQLSYKLQ